MENQRRSHRGAGRRKRGLSALLSLPARRAIAAASALLLVLLAVGVNAGGNETGRYYATLVASEPRIDAVVTAEHWGWGRVPREYDVTAGGRTYSLYDEFMDAEPEVGQDVEVVIDPEDSTYAIAVGEPENRITSPREQQLALGASLAVAVFLAVWLSAKLLPEDRQRLSARFSRLGRRSG